MYVLLPLKHINYQSLNNNGRIVFPFGANYFEKIKTHFLVQVSLIGLCNICNLNAKHNLA